MMPQSLRGYSVLCHCSRQNLIMVQTTDDDNNNGVNYYYCWFPLINVIKLFSVLDCLCVGKSIWWSLLKKSVLLVWVDRKTDFGCNAKHSVRQLETFKKFLNSHCLQYKYELNVSWLLSANMRSSSHFAVTFDATFFWIS